MTILSERELIKRISQSITTSNNVIKGIGDDCAVLPFNDTHFILQSTDTLVEKNHFNTDWSTPQQIGKKAIESNVSDIAAMGGNPKTVMISLCIPKHTTQIFIDQLYQGIQESCNKYNIDIIGGNITSSESIIITTAITGIVKKDEICYRSDAKIGDVVMLSGPIGESAAALDALFKNISANTSLNLEPKAQLEFAQEYAKYCNAMIDISDGLASEINHICNESNTGAIINKNTIPLTEETKRIATLTNKDPYEYALNGGEDFQLLCTISLDNIDKVPGIIIGKIVEKEQGVSITQNNEKKILQGGYDHFTA